MEELQEDYSGLSREEQLELAEASMEKMHLAFSKYSYTESADYARKALWLFRNLKIWDKYLIARKSLLILWASTSDMGIISQPICYVEETLELANKLISENHDIMGDLLTAAFHVYSVAGKYYQALEYAKKNLQLAEKNYPSNHNKVIRAYTNLAHAYDSIGNYSESIAFNKQAIKSDVEDGAPIINTHINLALSYYHYGEQELALITAHKTLEIISKSKGDLSKQTCQIYNNIGLFYGEMGDHKQQAMYYKKTFDLVKTIFDKKSPFIALTQQNLGIALNSLNQYDKAAFHLQEALKLRKQIFKANHPKLAMSHQLLGEHYRDAGKHRLQLKHVQQELDIRLASLGKLHPFTLESFKRLAEAFSLLKQKEKAMKTYLKTLEYSVEVWGTKHPKIARLFMHIAHHHLRYADTDHAIEYIQKSEKIIKQRNAEVNLLTKNFIKKEFLLPINQLKANVYFQHYLQYTQLREDLEQAITAYKLSINILYEMRQGYHNKDSKLLWNTTQFKLYEKGIEAALELQTLKMEGLLTAFQFAEKAKASLLLNALQTEHANAVSSLPTKLLKEERQIKLKLTYFDKRIQQLQSKKEKRELNEYETQSLKDCQDDFFYLHQNYTTFLQQLETDYPDYYQLKYDTQTVTPTEFQSILIENQVVISYFIGEDKLYIFVVTPDEFEVIDLQLPNDFEALIEGFMTALTQHQFTAFTEKSHQLYQLLIAPIRDFIVDDFGFDEEEELKQVFVIPHGVLSYVPFEALIGEEKPLSRLSTVDKVVETLSTVGDLDNSLNNNSLNDNSWSNLDYLIHYCQISYHYSATLLYRHLLKKQTEEELANSFAGFAPIYDSTIPSKSPTANLPESEQTEALQQSAKSMQAWATRSDAIRTDGTWVSLPHSETEAKGIAQLFTEKGLNSEVFLREKASKTGFEEAAKRFKFLLVAAHGLVNDEKTALSGLVFYPSGGSERWEQRSEEQGLVSDNSILTSRFSHPTSQTDNVLSMEETHHLDLQSDLVVLSSCESGIGKLHKGEGMMAVNRGFLAAGANNVISTLFKVYDKPSSLLTQYLFEAILEGKEYSAALRTAKLKLMQQPNIDPKSWSGFVLIGG